MFQFAFIFLNIYKIFPKNIAMEKAKVKGKTSSKFARGTLILTIGALLCKVIGAFYRIPLSNILGPEGIGVYQLVFPVYSLFLIFASGGVPAALSKLVASCRAKGEKSRAKRFLFQAILLLAFFSLVFALLFFLLGAKIATFQGNSLASLGYVGAAAAIIFASVLTAFRGYFQGYQNMLPTAVSQILEQVLKLVLGLTFAFLLMPKGVGFGAMGAMLGVAAGEVVALAYLFASYLVKREKTDILEPKNEKTFWQDFWIFIKQVFPITLNASILPLILAVDSFLIVNLLNSSGVSSAFSTQMFGVYSGMVNSLINFPTIVSTALATALIPAISFQNELGKNERIESIFKIVFFVSIPFVFIFLAFSRQIIAILYPSATQGELLEIGALLLRICAINVFYISILQVATAILQAKNRSFGALLNLFVAGIVKVLLTVFLVQSPLLIYGAAVASVMCYAISSGLNIIMLRGEVRFGLSVKSVCFIFLNSLLSIGIAVGFNELFLLAFSGFVSMIFALLIAGFSYLLLCVFTPIFEDEEIEKIPFGTTINFLRNKLKFRKSGNT